MKLYFAGAEAFPKIMERLNIKNEMFSFCHMAKGSGKKLFARDRNTFLDSGGFSAMSIGAPISIEEYSDYVLEHKDNLTYYAQLDVVGNVKKTHQNLLYMEKRGLKPLPVFHFKSDYKRLEELSQQYQYICLGGLVPLTKNKDLLKKHLDKCFSIIKTKVKLHGFGMTAQDILERYPFYSADSSSYIEANRRGTYFEFSNGKMKTFWIKDKKKASYKSIQFSHHGEKKWIGRIENAIKQYLKLEKHINKLWEKKGITW